MSEEVEDAIARAHRDARATWPDVHVDAARFDGELRRRLGDAIDHGLTEVRTADVYLAVACLDGDAAAITHLERDVMSEIGFVARKMRVPEALADDVRGHLRRVLFTAEPGRAAALASFAGRAHLKSYLRVMATRELRRAADRDQRAEPLEPLLDRLAVWQAPELGVLRVRHEPDLSAALRAALAALDERTRAVLRYTIVEGWTVDQLGEIYDVHRSTAGRWVAAARDELAEQLRREVSARLAIDVADVDSIVRELRSQVDISLARIL